MDESVWCERYGRLTVKCEKAEEGYTQLLNLLAKVVSGEIDRSRVMVNLTDRTCIFAPEGFRPELPATINGLPVCVVAPTES